MTDTSVYMDNHATTCVDPRALEAMLPYFCEKYGNAASINHVYGWQAGDAVGEARFQIASLLSAADAKSIIFTSGATEANNIALKGTLWASKSGSHFITNVAEHKAILDPAEALQEQGFQVTVLPVDRYGMVDPRQVIEAIRTNTVLVSVMLGNNEVGTVNPIKDIGRICRERGIYFHTDATQAVGKLPIDLSELPVDLLSLSAHKMYGPKGIGALYIRRGSPRVKLRALVDGGGHERHLRSGTLAVPLVVAFGVACKLCQSAGADEAMRVANLRDRLWEGLKHRLDGLVLNGHPKARLPGNLNVSFEGVNSEALIMNLKDVVAVSSGSACTTAEPEPSHVLTAMGIHGDLTDSTIRFGLGRFNTEEEVALVVDATSAAVNQLRQLSSG